MILDVNDSVRLADGITYDPTSLEVVDLDLGARHPVNSTALRFLQWCDRPGGISINQAAQHMSSEFGSTDTETVGSDLLELTRMLDGQGLVKVGRPWRYRIKPRLWSIQLGEALFTGSDSQIAFRYRMSASGVGRAVLRVSLPVSLGYLTIVALSVLIVPQINPTLSASYVAGISAGVVTLLMVLLLTVWAHEFGHVSVIRSAGKGGVVLVRGWRIAVIHRADSQVPRLRLAAAGPFSGLLAGILCGLPWLLGFEFLPLEPLRFAPLVGASHLLVLLPWGADGRMFWSSLRRRDSHGSRP